MRGVRAFQYATRRKSATWDGAASIALEFVLEWRRKEGIESLARQTPERLGRFDELWTWSRCGNDEWGHPVCWDRLGAVAWDPLLHEFGEEEVCRLFFRRLERLRLEKLQTGEEKGHAVYKHVYIVDLSELSMMRVLQRSNRELISHTLGAVSSFYPETMLKMFLVNAPRVFPHIWRVVQPMIDPVSAAKINILGPLDGDDAAKQLRLDAGVDRAFLNEHLARRHS